MYKCRFVITGYQIGLNNPSIYVAIPHKYFIGRGGNEQSVAAVYDGERKLFTLKESVADKTFPDKFKPGETYTLFYFLWKEVKNNVS